jgi:polysaccharide export outer membrane protein
MKIIKRIILFGSITFIASCVTQQKMPLYLEGANNENIEKNIQIPELKIQKNDLLAIKVYSDYTPTDPNPDLLYNQPTPDGGAGSSTAITSLPPTSTGGYLVDVNGNIDYPRLGLIKAEGLTKLQLENEIKKRLTSPVELLKNPTVIVRFQSYKITLLGEFNAPQTLTIPTEKVTVFEAISMAGGITEWGRKDAVQIVREQDGKRETGIIDLSSPTVFNSPYYYLKQNDILFINPIPQKAKNRDEQITSGRISLATGIFSSIVAVTTFLLTLSKWNK